MILLIDNYDSFTYNLVQLAGGINPDIKVVRNNEITLTEIEQMNPSHIIISPGPGYPFDAGICESVIDKFRDRFVILGVCLGHQAICEVMGASITHAHKLIHGKQTNIKVDSKNKLFKGLPEVIKAARYHSLIAERATIPDTLQIIAEDMQKEVMAVQIIGCETYGVQFHPESILTPEGERIIGNFLDI